MAAFYDDGTGLCYWCPEIATGEWLGLPLCDEHFGAEAYAAMGDMGVPGIG